MMFKRKPTILGWNNKGVETAEAQKMKRKKCTTPKLAKSGKTSGRTG